MVFSVSALYIEVDLEIDALEVIVIVYETWIDSLSVVGVQWTSYVNLHRNQLGDQAFTSARGACSDSRAAVWIRDGGRGRKLINIYMHLC